MCFVSKILFFSCVLSGKQCIFLWCKLYFNTTSCVHYLIITQHLVLSCVSCVSGVFSCVSLASLVVCLCFVWCLVSFLVVCFVLLIIFIYQPYKRFANFQVQNWSFRGLYICTFYTYYSTYIVPNTLLFLELVYFQKFQFSRPI